MSSIIELPSIKKSVLINNNLISQFSNPIDIKIDEYEYTLRLSLETDQKPAQPNFASTIKAGDSTFIITLNQWPEFMLKDNSDVVPLLRSRSRIVRELSNEVLLSPIAKWIENITGKKPIIFDSVDNEIQLIKPYTFNFYLTPKLKRSELNKTISGTIKVNHDNSIELEKLLRDHAPSSINSLDHLGLKTRLNIGASTLSTSELYDLEMGDVILFDKDIYGNDKNISAIISDRIQLMLLHKKISTESNNEEDVLMVDKITNQIHKDTQMTDEQSGNDQKSMQNDGLDSQDENNLGHELNFVDEINVKLDFDLGSISLPLSEVKKLSPGYVLSLHKPIDTSVHIYSNGQLLGIGEIVNIEGTTGVRLKSFLGK